MRGQCLSVYTQYLGENSQFVKEHTILWTPLFASQEIVYDSIVYDFLFLIKFSFLGELLLYYKH